MKTSPSALAIGAHPDDIEFQMAGTLLLLKRAGYDTHYMNLASGNCGSLNFDSRETRRLRAHEARIAANRLGARFYSSLTDDLEIVYDPGLLRRLAAAVREVQPAIVLPPRDYMEDHTATCRLVVTACFARGMANFKTVPSRPAYQDDLALYHCMPHGLRDELRRRVVPGAYVNTASVHQNKLKALSAHQSQQAWLETSQGMNSYLREMENMSLDMGRMSGKFKHAEGWRRHLHLGLSTRDEDPLATALGKKYLLNKTYESGLEIGE